MAHEQDDHEEATDPSKENQENTEEINDQPNESNAEVSIQ